jgi:hypothetical protein
VRSASCAQAEAEPTLSIPRLTVATVRRQTSVDREQRWFMFRIFLGAFPRRRELMRRRAFWVARRNTNPSNNQARAAQGNEHSEIKAKSPCGEKRGVDSAPPQGRKSIDLLHVQNETMGVIHTNPSVGKQFFPPQRAKKEPKDLLFIARYSPGRQALLFGIHVIVKRPGSVDL